jgi:hypothetical protein
LRVLEIHGEGGELDRASWGSGSMWSVPYMARIGSSP